MDTMAAIRATFFEECAEQLQELEAGLLAMEGGQTDSETVNAVFRAVHSIKGGAGAFNLDALVQFAHAFETVLDLVRSERLEADQGVVRVLLRSADVLTDLVTAARDGGTVDPARPQALMAELSVLAGGGGHAAAAPAQQAPVAVAMPVEEEIDFVPVAVDFSDMFAAAGQEVTFRVRVQPKPSLYEHANDAARLIRETMALGTGSVTCHSDELPDLAELEPEGAALSWTLEITTAAGESAIHEIYEFVEGDCDITVERVDDEAPQLSAEDLDAQMAVLLGSIGGGASVPFADEPAEAEPLEQARPNVVALTPPVPSAAPAAAAAPAPAASTDGGADKGTPAGPVPTIRVDLERVDRLIDLVGELVIHQVMLSQRVMQAGLTRASDIAIGLDELEQLTREMQDSVMAIRAQPVKSVFQKLPRLVREVAERTGKSVRLVTEGEYTEVDKTVIERLSDPLTHMIRNAIDHGLETPEGRIAAGKPTEGVVRVAAMHRSGRIVIEISDDGAGINRKAVFDIAVAKGLVPADAQLSDDELDNLVFLPGFSTKKEVSELSGRGVGMDVVKRSIQALGGRVSITSRPGKGSLFSMSLPLTLAVLDGMIVSCGEHTLVVPMTAIIETLRPKQNEVKPFGGDQRVINVRDSFLPLIDVSRQLGYRRDATDAMAGVAILVEAENGQRSALLVDSIQGQRQVVIKSLEANYGRVAGIAAATILGDGRVALILDIDAVAASTRFENGIAAMAAE
ncbi:chemotaxis protein CheA [Aureimonas phyllosphaerae]|uniref:Chemotaxis protein CheA n=1 Tax=Aureimonas phyllosphaerae TaxID=1166078 RepID=A0A7W6BQS9_9HYPH|nr:chemotaxis protein CheA [Aureimonas phyllosphaerae]MBB3934314.1 two-component system chemotaxis sensor kinase CheA [Aureimonas phyllosphaerae]MBB3958470.1 two-component system chemotaxis sensor kinase CheA [Aureimonas phyllosphaerae]SFE97603.1 two-component system, chemotaxis family, sensor kinase CheA [Aureimonas phyllosphaerae]